MATTKAPRKEKEQIKRPDLKIGIKDFGPIAEGEIELKPLTVFIGPNNSGKSYAAMLIHSIFESFNLSSIKKNTNIEKNGILDQIIYELITKIRSLRSGEDWQIPNEIWQKVTQEEIKEISETQLGETIIRLYASQLKDLIMFGKDSFVLDIGFTSYNIHLRTDGLRLIAKHFLQPMQNMDYRVKISESTNHIDNEKRKLFILSSGVGIALNESEEISVLRQFLILDLKELIYKMLNIFVLKCYYFPASRTGILQLYRGFSANVIKQQEIPKLSSVISDFISNMIEISDKEKGFYFQFAEELSKELLKGDIILVSEDKIFIPEIKYRFKGVDIPLNRVSTSVSELAPLILYLKYIVKPGSVLIIEEPEAHLHPGNIRILAKYLVRLVKKGVNVLITTHSEYLLEQLDNFVMLSNIDPEEIVERYGYEKDDFLKHTDFAVYEFHYDQNTGTSKIEKARLTKKDGVSQEEFVKVFEELYEETDKLRRDLSDE